MTTSPAPPTSASLAPQVLQPPAPAFSATATPFKVANDEYGDVKMTARRAATL
jgi:hypothetical protein